ncbi:class I SAM-dependent methyltransferase [Brachybacterium halotolerans subsp. kimchii]|uniref:class I SAM-dependent methyltransferase n=1 Tax=Brachybacterium halotolerans TaxID=2795215 RepID=UPI001E59A6BF|nr:class I SAM-dependent methyltransferase [Brachybacterium halotolerans]UEJ83624.1 class I SAM-dependent methyltransferase [Brachybacterium halotolerans subsp. kimchii]
MSEHRLTQHPPIAPDHQPTTPTRTVDGAGQQPADQQRLWDSETARSYDTPGEGMFAPDVLGPTVEALRDLVDGGRALEFAIGTGRVAIPLRESGVEVVGIELSEAMIARLREKAPTTDAKDTNGAKSAKDARGAPGATGISVVQGDMTTASAGEGFSLVYLVFNTLGNLLSQEEQVACFRNAARHLRPGGCFVIEMYVPQLRALTPGHGGVLEVSEPGYLLVDTIDTVTQQLVSHHVRFDPTVDGPREARIGRTPQRYVWPSEMDLMARLAGFEREHRWADWDRSAFTAESSSHVSVYRLGT